MRGFGRRGKIIVGILGGLVVAAAGLVLALSLSSPAPSPPLFAVEEKQIPLDWTAPAPGPDTATPDAAWSSTGSLTFEAGGRSLGNESYALRVSPDGVSLTSVGGFAFRVVLAQVRVTFEQEWIGTARFEPVSFSLAVDAPLGWGYAVNARVDGDEVVAARGREQTRVPIDRSRTLMLGMFSTYALIPAQFKERAQGGVASFDALMFGGPPGTAASSGGGMPTLLVEQREDVTVSVAGRPLSLEQYRLTSALGESLLFAKGREFLALVAGTAERRLVVYRDDYFPDGFPEPALVLAP